jgi:hypothetical protein
MQLNDVDKLIEQPLQVAGQDGSPSLIQSLLQDNAVVGLHRAVGVLMGVLAGSCSDQPHCCTQRKLSEIAW